MRIGTVVLCCVLAGCGGNPAPKTEAKAPPQAARPRITLFYASPATPALGETANLCYGVENADQVTLDPPVDKVWPALTRCIGITASKRVTYTLTARRGSETVSQSVTVAPGPPAVKLIDVTVSSAQVAPGGEVTVCFHAKNATRVTIRPGQWVPPHDDAVGCARDTPKHDTTYVVTASGPGGSDVQRVPVKVK